MKLDRDRARQILKAEGVYASRRESMLNALELCVVDERSEPDEQ